MIKKSLVRLPPGVDFFISFFMPLSLSSVAIKKSIEELQHLRFYFKKDAKLCSKVYAQKYQNNVKNNSGKYICQLTMHESCVSQPGTKCS